MPDGQTPVRLRVGCEFRHDLRWGVPMVLQVEPRSDAVAWVTDSAIETAPGVPVHRYVDSHGNVCHRFLLGPGRTSIRFEADVTVDGTSDPVALDAVQHPVHELPDEVLQFTLPSRYCESDRLANTAWRLFGGVVGGWSRAQAICDWVHDNLTFMPGSSGTTTAATDVYLQRQGVCRDFAQLAVSFMRALNIPARYCFGYLPDVGVVAVDEPMDFVAWLEAYIGGRWYTFDPRNNIPRIGRVLVGRGRDALDVAMLTTFGDAPLAAMRVTAEVATAPYWSTAEPPVLGDFRSSWP